MVEGFDCSSINLKKGSKGSLVSLLQKHLKNLGYYTYYNGHYLKIDGDFQKYTCLAVKSFQKATGHSQDGVFGPLTCKSLNEKIGAYTPSTTSSSGSGSGSGSSTTTSTATNKATQQAHIIQNVYTAQQSNLHIAGVHLIASTVTPTNHFKKGQWKTAEMTDDTYYPYKGHSVLREYSVECYLSHSQFKKLEYDLNLISDKKCSVSGDTMITPGDYLVNITVAEEKLMEKKLTIKLIETT